MFSSTSTVAAVTALFAASTLAAPSVRRDDGPFELTVTSLNSGKYNGAYLAAQHAGAGENALAILYDGYYTNFTFAETSGSSPTGYGPPGYLQYLEPASPSPVLQQLNFVQNSSSNTQAFFFGEGSGPVAFTFASDGGLFHSGGADEADSYFYICPISQLGYNYEVLSYVAEGTPPDNEGCDEVTVQKA